MKTKLVVLWMVILWVLPGHIFAQWQTLKPAYFGRLEAQSVVLNNKIYVFSGLYNQSLNITNTCEHYDPQNNTWTLIANIPRPVSHAAFTLVDKNVWIAGGFEGNHPGKSVNIVQIYNSTTNSWSTGPSLPEPMASNHMALLGRKLHIFAGLLPDRRTDHGMHYVLDLDNMGSGWKSAPALPNPRNHFSAVSLGGKIYAIGGQLGHDGFNTDVKLAHVFDPAKNAWQQIANLPSARSHTEPGTFVVDGKILVVGGQQENSAISNRVTEFDPNTGIWKELPVLAEKLSAPSSKVIGDKLYVSHGMNGTGVPQKTTRSRTVSRAFTDKLGFLPENLSVTLAPNSQITKPCWLFTLNRATNYTIQTTTLPSWLKIVPSSGSTDTNSEEIGLIINTNGMTSGNYSANVIAKASGFADVSMLVQLTVSGGGATVNQAPTANAGPDKTLTLPQNSTVINGSGTDPEGATLNFVWAKVSGPSVTMSATNTSDLSLSGMVEGSYVFRLTTKDPQNASDSDDVKVTVVMASTSGANIRIRCGSTTALTYNGQTFAGDKYFSSGTSTYTNNNISDIKNTDFDALYKVERSAGVNLGSFAYNIPVINGTYDVRLHFAEIFFGATGAKPLEGIAGKRVFSVKMEGQNKLVNFDIVQEVGSMTAVIKTFTITVSDGTLNINFIPSVNRPKISGIEILTQNTATSQSVSAIENSLKTGTSEEDLPPNEKSVLKAYPNPSDSEINIAFTAENSGSGSLILVNAQAELVNTLYTGVFEAGKAYHFKLNAFDYAEGIYVARLINGKQGKTIKILIRK